MPEALSCGRLRGSSDEAPGLPERVAWPLWITGAVINTVSRGNHETHDKRSAEFLPPASRFGLYRRDFDDDCQGSVGSIRARAADRACASAGENSPATEARAAGDRTSTGHRALH